MRIYASVFLFLLPFFIFAQQKKGGVEVTKDKRIDQLIEKHQQINTNMGTVSGYRVQIFFDSGSNSRSKAVQVKDQFTEKHPGIETYMVFHEPYYKIRVGNFRTRMEAQGFKQKLLTEYPSAFVVKDDIILPNVE